ncbi:type VI secretion system-associated lipoprotein [Brenneria goodwinii]|uniref:Type VI secretion system-associated lipoprotein n=1 Tax=Brenneria goodwinii TaxID=1109412 RepID=A0AAE8EPT3_9GAMM|nr:type VI secretion system lipoprotein TssJ [Brenneria goodwinii]ATA23347.1 type VI secretion protein [Brenneria goodwinii]MCG8157207.1 type VI secretion system lipoprotein TssJ [Brenneria goodwinii]MCG8163653.1 type VI secretion system lipoprotein TssJ [Brenneria goodwinii]MCG8166091.1 type VI secretion system lipoprotein TssJ [Brenneria goodwinii]MCG8170718.1 type VI secretion system lipoprotein TssJ [Brenneria goodwinii]
MAVITSKFNVAYAAIPLILATTLTGCGLTQSVSDGTVSMTRSLFYKTIKTLHLDFTTRSTVNADDNNAPLATVIRIYQLRDRKAFDRADYQTLLENANEALKGDILAERDVTVMPDGSAALDMPMEQNARYVAVFGLFRSPDIQGDTWRVVLERNDLDPDEARRIQLESGGLKLLPED